MSNNNYKKRGFTMIEMLVSTAIFSIVITMIMGTIVTIVDASRKSRTMTEVMNNLNFSFESMTRTLKTGKNISVDNVNGTKLNTIKAKDQKGREVVYTFSEDGITKSVSGGVAESITAGDLKLTSWYIDDYISGSTGGAQPRVFFSVKGRVETARGIASEFTLQSSVTQRQLELGN